MKDIVKVRTEKSDRPVKMYTKEKIDKLLEGKENDLDQSISSAHTLKSDLDTSISVANDSSINLDNSTSVANTAKSNLDDSISTASSTKTSLDQSISNGDFLSKTNTSSYTPVTNFNPATKKYVDDSISYAGGGDMLKTVYDSNNNGKVDSADSADSVEWDSVNNKPVTFQPSIHNHDSDYSGINHNHDGTYEPALPSKTGKAGKVLVVNDTEDSTEWVAQRENAVDSVNGETGAVVLTTDDITDTPTNRYVSDNEKSVWNGKADQSNTYTKIETDNKINGVIGAAPLGLNTLEKIAESLNDDNDFSGTMTDKLAGKVDKVVGKQLSTEDYSTSEKSKLTGIETNANKYVHPSTHPASTIVQDANNRFVTDTEKMNWNDANTKKHAHTNKSVLDGISQALTDGWNSAVLHISDAVKHITSSERTLWNTVSNKVDKVTGKQLSTEDYSTADKSKLAGIENSANKYVHPSTHSMDMMTESTTKKIMTDVERAKLVGIEANSEVNNISDANAADLTDGEDSALHYHTSDRNRANHTGTQSASTISNFTATVRGTVLAGLSTASNTIIAATDTILSALGKLQKQISDNLAAQNSHISNKSNPHSVTKSQVGLGSVDNTSDVNKPISTATQTALNDKLGKTEKSVDSDKLDGRDSSQFQHRQVHDFYVEGDANTYYPVVIQSLYSPVDMISNIQVYRNYSWNAPGTWNTATHKGGLCLDMNMNLYGWGGHNYTSDVMLSQQYSKMVADIRVPLPDTDSIVVWLRGGHALYRCFANVNQPISVTVYLDQYINKEGTQYENTYYPKTTIIPELDKIGVLRFSSEADYIIGTGYRDVIGGKKIALRDSNNDLITNSNIHFSNNDGFSYDDTLNKMYLKTDGINRELYHQGNFDPESKSDITHNHNTAYEPKNSNIQNHIASAHAPSNAQKNSDITKAEIEAKLTGTIATHSHNPNHTHSNKTVLDKLSMSGAESSFDLSNFVTTDELNAAGYGDMDKSVYGTNNNGKVDVAENADNVSWTGVSEKPSTFPPSTHNHTGVYEPVFTKNSAFNKNFGTSAGTAAEGNHNHAISNVAGLQTELNNKVTYSGTDNGYSDRTNLAVGWYTIAINSGNRAIGRFGIRDVNSGDHQSVVFYASHHYGANSDITVLHHSRFSGSPFKYIRIKEGSTYDGAMLQVHIDDSTNKVSAYLLGDNFQTGGWAMRNFVPDGTDPTGLGNFSALTNEAVKIDLDLILGGVATSGEFYSNGNKVWHTGNDGSGSGLDADTVDGKQATQLAKTMHSNGTAMNNNTTLESGFYTISDGATIGLSAKWYHILNMKHFHQNGYNAQIAVDLSHSTDLYVRFSSGGTWSAWNKIWHAGNDGSGSGLDADKLGGAHKDTDVNLSGNSDSSIPTEKAVKTYVDTKTSQAIPTGIISMWSGSVSSIPSGWHICDGTSGTPDLRNRFIVGAGSSYAVGATGGAVSVTLTEEQLPSHNHSGTTTSDGSHTHDIKLCTNSDSDHEAARDSSYGSYYGEGVIKSAGAHTHAFTTDSVGNSNSHENRPPYYALAYIMKL